LASGQREWLSVSWNSTSRRLELPLVQEYTNDSSRSFIIQIAGGLMTISKNFQTLQNGLHIYTAGVALQEFFIFCFILLVYQFQRRLSRECNRESVLKARKLLYVMYISLGLISVGPFLACPQSSLLTF